MRQFCTAPACILKAGLTRAGIGVTGVDQQIAHLPFFKMLPGDNHGGRAEGVAGEDRRTGCSLRQGNEREIITIRIFYAGGSGAYLNTGNRQK